MDKILITGCGRSGTGYISNYLTGAGIKCGHEDVFTLNGFKGWKDYEADSSWFAAPFLDELDGDVRIVHIVRHPDKVVNSFYRLGLFSTLSWRNYVMNPDPIFIYRRFLLNPKYIVKRYLHVKGHRKLLKENSSSLDRRKSEINRIYDYWYEWNSLIEEQCKNKPYLQVNIESIDKEWGKISNFLDVEIASVSEVKKNKKKAYPAREIDITERPNYITELMKKYGY